MKILCFLCYTTFGLTHYWNQRQISVHLRKNCIYETLKSFNLRFLNAKTLSSQLLTALSSQIFPLNIDSVLPSLYIPEVLGNMLKFWGISGGGNKRVIFLPFSSISLLFNMEESCKLLRVVEETFWVIG